MIDVKSHGATGNGQTDDTEAIQRAIFLCIDQGGGAVYFPKGVYALKKKRTIAGVSFCLAINGDNILITGKEACLLNLTDVAATFFITGRGKPDLFNHSRYAYTGLPVYEIEEASRYSAEIALKNTGDAVHFKAGDSLFIRTGQTRATTLQPDSEINRVVAVDGVKLILETPLCKDYTQEYFIEGDSGQTSSEVTDNPALLGVSNVANCTLQNIEFEGIFFDQRAVRHALIGAQIEGLKIRDCRGKFNQKGLMSVGTHKFTQITNNRLHRYNKGVAAYMLDTDAGSSDFLSMGNMITSEAVTFMHIHEGSSRVKCIGDSYINTPSSEDENAVSVRARAYDIQLLDLTVINAGATNAVFIDENCKGGGIINNLAFHGNSTNAINLRGKGWKIGAVDTEKAVRVTSVAFNNGPTLVGSFAALESI